MAPSKIQSAENVHSGLAKTGSFFLQQLYFQRILAKRDSFRAVSYCNRVSIAVDCPP